ncbi:MAG: hypothetical protein JWO38_7473 [Gemmataceae bacterium]|nr:hypothetical protein [Gemmataceae bacterium]
MANPESEGIILVPFPRRSPGLAKPVPGVWPVSLLLIRRLTIRGGRAESSTPRFFDHPGPRKAAPPAVRRPYRSIRSNTPATMASTARTSPL